MNYHEFRQKLKDFAVFSLTDLRKIYPKFHRGRLNDWQNKGYIKKLRRGYYMFADTVLNEETLFLVANKLYPPSYVSFEIALAYYGLIPEGVYLVTSVSSKKTTNFKTPVGEFSFRRIKRGIFFGYRLEKILGQAYKIAEMEKAVLDYLYVNPHFGTTADFYEWRFNSKEFLAKVDLKKLDAYAKAFNNKRLLQRLEDFLVFIRAT